MAGLVTHHDIYGSLIGVVVGQRGERRSQTGHGRAGQLVPSAAHGIVAAAGLAPLGIAVHRQSALRSEQEFCGIIIDGIGAIGQVMPDGHAGARREPAQTTNAGLPAGKTDVAGVEINAGLGKQRQILGLEGANQGEPSSGAKQFVFADGKECFAELGGRVSLVAVSGAGDDIGIGWLAEVGAVLPWAREQSRLAASGGGPIGESLEVNHLAPDAAGGDLGQVSDGVGAEFHRAYCVGGFVWPGTFNELPYYRNGVIVGAAGELAGHACCEPLPEPRLVGIGQALQGQRASNGDGRGGPASPASPYRLNPQWQLGHGIGQRARLADVVGATVKCFVPAVFLGDHAMSGTQLFIAGAKGEPWLWLGHQASSVVSYVMRVIGRAATPLLAAVRIVRETLDSMHEMACLSSSHLPESNWKPPVYKTDIFRMIFGVLEPILRFFKPSYVRFLRNRGFA